MTKRRPLGEIKKRGRWLSDQSVRRYEKSAMALRLLQRLPDATVDYGLVIESKLEAIMLGRAKAPPPPFLGRSHA